MSKPEGEGKSNYVYKWIEQIRRDLEDFKLIVTEALAGLKTDIQRSRDDKLDKKDLHNYQVSTDRTIGSLTSSLEAVSTSQRAVVENVRDFGKQVSQLQKEALTETHIDAVARKYIISLISAILVFGATIAFLFIGYADKAADKAATLAVSKAETAIEKHANTISEKLEKKIDDKTAELSKKIDDKTAELSSELKTQDRIQGDLKVRVTRLEALGGDRQRQ